MFKTLKGFNYTFFLFYIFLLTFDVNLSFGEEDFGFGPLFSVERDTGSQEIDALGPFITYKKNNKTSEFGFRPLFYLLEDKERNSTEFDFLYPFATYDKREEDWRFQLLLYLISYESDRRESGFKEKEFTLFPFLFIKSAEEKKNSYFALFPIYGGIKNKFRRDEINFYLFPLFLQTKRGETTNYSFLWPFFGYYTGGGQEGFRFWPLFGYRKVVGASGRSPLLDEKFALWPIYASKRRIFYGEEVKSLSIFPFYSTFESPGRTQSTYLWPLFNHLVDKKKGIERWDVPWPLINFTRGSEQESRIFPFYANEMDGNDKEGFFLWPLYRYNTLTFEDYRRRRNTILFFLYSDIKEEPIIEGGRSGRRIDVWPLFSYKRDREGNLDFHSLSILEPFLSGNEGIERNYSSFWRLYTWKRDKDGKTTSSFLWNMYRSESSKEGIEIKFQPIIPIFSYKYLRDGSKTDFLGGLFGYRSNSHKSTIKLFFFPIDISSDKGGLKR